MSRIPVGLARFAIVLLSLGALGCLYMGVTGVMEQEVHAAVGGAAHELEQGNVRPTGMIDIEDDGADDFHLGPSFSLDTLFSEHEAFMDRFRAVPAEEDVDRWADSLLHTLSLDQKIGQLLLVHWDPRSIRDVRSIDEAISKYHIGGVLVPRRGQPEVVAGETNRLQQLSMVPLFFAADFERGAGGHDTNFTEVPSNMALGATRSLDLARAAGMLTAIESRSMGVNLLFAPVVDVNNNPENPIINVRSYSEHPHLVSNLAGAFVEGAESLGILTTLKHFPGHGNTTVDSHVQLGIIPGSRVALDSVELRPFQTLLGQARPPAGIMTAHLWAEALDTTPQPATMSRRVLIHLLRNTYKFNGLIITDDVEMGGLRNGYDQAERILRPLTAGVDILLTPAHLQNTVAAIKHGLEQGELDSTRIDASVRRILQAKARLNLHRERTVDRKVLRQLLARPRGERIARLIADEAVTLLKTTPQLPLHDTSSVALVQMTHQGRSESIRASMDELDALLKEKSVVTNHRVTGRLTRTVYNQVLNSVQKADVVVLSLYLRTQVGRKLGLEPDHQQLAETILKTGKPVVLVTFGHPYAVESFPGAAGIVVAYEQSLASIRAVANVLTGRHEPRGRLPITIGPYPFGSGLTTFE